MDKYHKIQTVFKRDPETKYKTLLMGEYSLPEFAYLCDNVWIFTEKVDGTNVRVEWNGTDVKIGGRTDNAQMPTFLYSKLAEIFTPNRFPLGLGNPKEPMILFGEGYGAGIQKSGGNYKPDGVDFVLFDVKCGKWRLTRESIKDIAEQLGIKCVPVIGTGTLPAMVEMVRTQCGIKSHWGDFLAEGIVARPEVELLNRGGNRIITKIKTKDFAGE